MAAAGARLWQVHGGDSLGPTRHRRTRGGSANSGLKLRRPGPSCFHSGLRTCSTPHSWASGLFSATLGGRRARQPLPIPAPRNSIFQMRKQDQEKPTNTGAEHPSASEDAAAQPSR